MKIHFFGSLSGNKDNYFKIIETIESLGYELITKHSIDRELSDIYKETPKQSSIYIERMNKWMKQADIIVAEVTSPDLGVGYELATALELEKPIIALYTDGKDPKLLVGQGELSEKMQVVEYSLNNLKNVLKIAINTTKELQDVRFNFFVSPKIVNYLDWVAKKRKMPRAVYLRRLIEKDLQKNKEFIKEEK